MAAFQKWLLIVAVALSILISIDSAEGGIPPRQSELSRPKMTIKTIVIGDVMVKLAIADNYIVRAYWDRDNLHARIELIPVSLPYILPDPPPMLRAGHSMPDVSDAAFAVARRDEPLHEHEFGLVFIRFV